MAILVPPALKAKMDLTDPMDRRDETESKDCKDLKATKDPKDRKANMDLRANAGHKASQETMVRRVWLEALARMVLPGKMGPTVPTVSRDEGGRLARTESPEKTESVEMTELEVHLVPQEAKEIQVRKVLLARRGILAATENPDILVTTDHKDRLESRETKDHKDPVEILARGEKKDQTDHQAPQAQMDLLE